jgi:hypothetical protein
MFVQPGCPIGQKIWSHSWLGYSNRSAVVPALEGVMSWLGLTDAVWSPAF